MLTPGVIALAIMSTSVHLAGDRDRLRAPLRRAQAARLVAAAPVRPARRQGRRAAARRAAPVRRDRRAPRWRWAGAAGDRRRLARLARWPCCWGPRRSPASACSSPATLRAEATLAVANLVYLLLLAAGRWCSRLSSYGGAATALAGCRPRRSGRDAQPLLGGGASRRSELLVLARWAVVGIVLTARTFRGSDVTSTASPTRPRTRTPPRPGRGRMRPAAPSPRWSATSRSSSPAGWSGSPAPASAARPGRGAPASRSSRTASWASTAPSSSATGC